MNENIKVLIAMDSFKGSLSSLEAAALVEKGIKRVCQNANIQKIAAADGGEGTVEAIVETMKGQYVYLDVHGPMGNIVKARYGIINGNIAVIEMAQASGLCLVEEGKNNSHDTSTYGTGQLILDALNKGVRKIILGIGGSATNDGGTGMAKALGVRFLDIDQKELKEGGGWLHLLSRIDMSGVDPRIKDTEILAACDVTNPLYGDKGASKIFGPQKGASPHEIEKLDNNLKHLGQLVCSQLCIDAACIPGAGAAGGLGFGLMVFCGAKLVKGIELVLDTIDIDSRMKDADIIITGEGRTDGQTIYGKVPVGIAARAKKYNKPVYIVAGYIDKGAEALYEHGIDGMVSSISAPMTIHEAINNTRKLIVNAAERLFRIIKSVK